MLKMFSYGLALLCLSSNLFAQDATTSTLATQSWLEGGNRSTAMSSPPLPHPETRPTDILWEKRVWREIDTREKLNLVFRTPGQSLYELLDRGIKSGDIRAYDPSAAPFSQAYTSAEVYDRFNQTDTVWVVDPITNEYYAQVVTNEFDPERIKRWRLAEVWYFDARYSQLRVRILGLAPIISTYGEDGETVRYTAPMYWINYAEVRSWLAQQQVFVAGNDKSSITWDDLFQMRRFNSHIYRESDLLGRRLQDYQSGTALLQKSDQIDEAIINREMDHWSY